MIRHEAVTTLIFACSCMLIVVLGTLRHQSVLASEVGVYPDRIVFGQTAPLSGSTASIGNSLRIGLNVAFAEVSQRGGVNGRSLILASKDDRYEPDLARENTISLIENDQIFALVGVSGTPTAKQSVAIASEHNIPFIAPLTGAKFLRDHIRFPTVINLRPSYEQETEAWIEYLSSIGVKRIAIFYQDDAFGRSGLKGVRNALSKRGMLMVARGTFTRNRTVLSTAAFDIRRAEPEAIVMVSTYKTSAEFIRLTRSLGLNPLFLNLSILGTDAFIEELGPDSEGVIVSQVLPSPWHSSIPLIGEFRNAMNKYALTANPQQFSDSIIDGHPEGIESLMNFISLEGYVTGRFVIEALQNIEGELTRKKFLESIFSRMRYDIGGLELRFHEGTNQGLHHVYLTTLDNDHHFKSIHIVDIFEP